MVASDLVNCLMFKENSVRTSEIGHHVAGGVVRFDLCVLKFASKMRATKF